MRTIYHLGIVFLGLPIALILSKAPIILFVPIALGYFEVVRMYRREKQNGT